MIFSLLASGCSKTIPWFGCRDALAVPSIPMLRHACYRNPLPIGLSISPEMA
ncbi:MAG: hypothetical protein OJF50_005112 [Nitrospira sp.]|jgi:hypothetical protein|nr:hypothetical protein [Nitrospira sp.]